MEQRLDRIENEIKEVKLEIKEFKKDVNKKFTKIDKRFDKVEKDISTIQTHIADLQVTQTQVISMLKDIQQGQNNLSSHIDWLVKKQEDTEQEQAIKDFRVEERLSKLEPEKV